MSKSKIEWTETTWNPVLGCSKVSEGCRNCYAMTMSARIANAGRQKTAEGKPLSTVEKAYMQVVPEDHSGKFLPRWNNNIVLVPDRLEDPLRWQKSRMVFVNSMSDLFHPGVPFEFIAAVFGVMAYCKDHTFQILTKRPERMAEFFTWIGEGQIKTQDGQSLDWDEPMKCIRFATSKVKHPDTFLMGLTNMPGREWPLPNVWLGTSVEDQRAADERIPHLLKCPAKVRFLSCEPLLGPVNLNESWHKMPSGGRSLWQLRNHSDNIHWVIAGGESGHNAQPMHPEWARSLRDQCVEAGVAFFFKQWGELVHASVYRECVPLSVQCEPMRSVRFEEFLVNGEPEIFIKPGKKRAGRLLDGKEWNQMPEVDHA